MNRVLSMTAVVLILSLGFVAGSQANSMAQRGFTTYDSTKLVGATVKARDGVELGQIVDLVVDSHGHVDFAIVDQLPPSDSMDPWPGHMVAVPFSALTISKGKSQEPQVVLNTDKEKFYEAPDWGSENLSNPKQAASVDRYYGIQPYWTEESGEWGYHW